METLSAASLASQLDSAGAYRKRCVRFADLSQPWWIRMGQAQLAGNGDKQKGVIISFPEAEPKQPTGSTVDEQVAQLAAAA